jgi:hypothetical protein
MSDTKHVAFIKTAWTPGQLNILISCCAALVNKGAYSQCRTILDYFHLKTYSELPAQLQSAFTSEVWKKIFPYLRKKHITCLEMLYFYSMYKSGSSFREIAEQIGRSYVRTIQYCRAIEGAQDKVFDEQSRMTLSSLVHEHHTLREITRSLNCSDDEVLSFLKTL